jgi:signal transduction histidine kinase
MQWETAVMEPMADTGGDDVSAGARALRWWYAPIAEREPWIATWYLIASAVLSLGWAVLTVVLLALALAGSVLVIGLPLAAWLIGLPVRFGALERRRTGWVGEPVRAPVATPAGGWRARLRDGVRWRAVGYFLLAPFVYLLLFALAIIGWGSALYLLTLPLWGWAVGVGPLGLVTSVLAGVVLGGLGPRAALVFAGLGVRFTAWLLGPDPVVAMQERVDALAANRDEILSAVASERRRIERNLHDGVQQHLVAVGIDLGLAAAKVDTDPEGALELLRSASDKNRATIGELRSIGRGLHPAVLDDRGLDAALSSVVASAPIPVSLEIDRDLELPIDTAETAYFIVSEAVTNIVKHARARTASVRVSTQNGRVLIAVHDDGRGGADIGGGTGLAGIAARVHGVDGSLDLRSPPGGPTSLEVELPHV